MKRHGILGFWRRGVQSRTRDKAGLHRALHSKVSLKYKGNRENFWHRYQKGAEIVPLCQSSAGCYIFTSSLLMKERNVLKLRVVPGLLTHKIHFGIILGSGHKMINLNLVEGQINIQIVSVTQVRGKISEYSMLVCQVSSEP